MKNKSLFFASLRLCGIISLLALSILAQTKIPAPRDVLGFTPGDDRKLASWAQTVEYFRKLDAASNRVAFEEIGKTTEGKPFVYATISAPANLQKLAFYQDIQKKLADPRLIRSNDKTAQALVKQGKTIVLITCGIHSTEVGSYLASMLIAERLANATDAETQKILENTIILLVPSLNPDGVDIVKNWYDKTLGTPFEGTNPPELYQKYVGHDNNRDWYAFTQVETQLTVDKIHNEWHPQIVHDIHQQGERGARLFIPPYLAPVEPNVPPQISEGFTELGNYIAEDLRKKGFQGITTDSTYDAWTPARAYSHYHGGVRILSETASARIASPVTIKFEDLRGDLGYDAKKESANFKPVWQGGEWKLRDITNYMTTAAFSLLKHSSDNRERWLTRFYQIGKEAVRPRKDGETFAYVYECNNTSDNGALYNILKRGGVEIDTTKNLSLNGRQLQDVCIVKMAQPYGSFAKAILERQKYPDLKDEKGNPIPPYDVTAHTLPLLLGVEVIEAKKTFKYKSQLFEGDGESGINCRQKFNYWIYRSQIPVMDEGWTRWAIENDPNIYTKGCRNHFPLFDKDIRNSDLIYEDKPIIFPDQSPAQILNGYPKGAMPDELVGGVGAEGVANLRKFVEDGGTLVFLNRASNFAIEQFKLPVKDVTQGLARKDFYIPGSILRTELDTTHPIAKGMPAQSIAWFENSPAFEIQTDPLALTNNFRIIARYPQKPEDILLSGWAMGTEKIAGKAALVEFTIGKGKIVLFGFRPQYRGQSLATFPLLFNAIAN